jgi:branched-chain amino acid transport system ATP-binding protein
MAERKAAAETPVLAVRGLRKAFGGVVAVDDVSFSLARGQMLAMIGPNGAGKSTCFNLIGGQIAADAGSVKLFGREITGLPPRRIWRLGVGRTFQVTAVFASMTVLENIQMALLSFHRRLGAVVAKASQFYADEAMALLERVQMADQAERPCSVLAYGDLKRVELAVALANSPALLLMDEPTAGMAPAERIQLMQLVSDIVAGRDISVLFTEHDMDVVFAHADRIVVLDRGARIAAGRPAEVRADAAVQAIYLGRPEPEAAPKRRT